MCLTSLVIAVVAGHVYHGHASCSTRYPSLLKSWQERYGLSRMPDGLATGQIETQRLPRIRVRYPNLFTVVVSTTEDIGNYRRSIGMRAALGRRWRTNTEGGYGRFRHIAL